MSPLVCFSVVQPVGVDCSTQNFDGFHQILDGFAHVVLIALEDRYLRFQEVDSVVVAHVSALHISPAPPPQQATRAGQ